MSAGKDYPVSLIVRAVDRLTGPLRAITAGLNRATEPAKRIGKAFSNFGEAAGFEKLFAGFSGIGGAVKNVADKAIGLGLQFAAMAAGAGFAFFSIVKGAVDAGSELQKMADRVGLGVNAYASLQFAAGQADIEQDEFNAGMDKFSKNLGAAKANGGPLLEFLMKVSPALAEQFKHVKNSEQGLSLLTDAFVRLDDPQKRAILATEAFGKSGAQFGEFLHKGSAEIQRQQIEYLRLAGSQEDFAESSKELKDEMRATEASFLGLRAAAAGALFPVFKQLATAVTQFMVDNREGIASWAKDAAATIQAWVNGGGIQRLIGTLRDLSSSILDFIDSVGGFKTVAIAAAAAMAGPLLAAIVGLVPPLVALGVALLTTPIGWFVLALAGITAAAVAIYKNWEPIKTFFKEFFPEQIKAVSEWVDAFKELYDLWKKFDNFQNHSGFAKGDNGWEWRTDLNTAAAPEQPKASWADAAETVKSLWNAKWGQPIGPTGPGAYAAATQSKVTVEFSNTPKGTRVTQNSQSQTPVDLDVGYSMVH